MKITRGKRSAVSPETGELQSGFGSHPVAKALSPAGLRAAVCPLALIHPLGQRAWKPPNVAVPGKSPALQRWGWGVHFHPFICSVLPSTPVFSLLSWAHSCHQH